MSLKTPDLYIPAVSMLGRMQLYLTQGCSCIRLSETATCSILISILILLPVYGTSIDDLEVDMAGQYGQKAPLRDGTMRHNSPAFHQNCGTAFLMPSISIGLIGMMEICFIGSKHSVATTATGIQKMCPTCVLCLRAVDDSCQSHSS